MSEQVRSMIQALREDTTDPRLAFEVPETGALAVVLCHFNPCAYKAPVRNLLTVLQWLRREEVPTYAVELRCGESLDKPPVLPENHPRVLQLRSRQTMFRKDNLWNIGAVAVPERFEYILCLDADAVLTNPDWKTELLVALQQHVFVQPFSMARWTNSEGHVIKERQSAGFGYSRKLEDPHISHKNVSGLGMAARREFWAKAGGFYNSPIGGGSLMLMSGLMGLDSELSPKLAQVSPAFLEHFSRWASNLFSWCGGSFGCVVGDCVHLWHGSRQKRQYIDRFQRLAGFDPAIDIVALAPFGVHEWSQQAIQQKRSMVASVEEYFVTRDEDEHYTALA